MTGKTVTVAILQGELGCAIPVPFEEFFPLTTSGETRKLCTL